MTQNEQIVARLLCPFQVCQVQNTKYLLYNPTHNLLYKSYVIYDELIRTHRFGNFTTDEQNLFTLVKNGLCDLNIDKDIEVLREKIDTAKLLLYRHRLRLNELKHNRNKIENLTKQLIKIINIRHSLDHLTLEDFAEKQRHIYLIKNSLVTFNNESTIVTDSLAYNVLRYQQKHSISYDKLREICRTDPWTIHWSINGKKVFRFINQYGLSEEQQIVINISEMLDSIRQCPDPPGNDIIQDNDMLDGWKLQRIKDNEEKMKEQHVSEKYGNKSGDIFIPATTQEEVDYVNSLNTGQANLIKKRREMALRQSGQLTETQLPDQQEKIRTLHNQQFMEKHNG